MSGHSKWSTIKHQKGANDAKRGQLFSKLARAITLAAREGGPDPDANLRLRVIMDKARESNMPKENIERAIDKGSGTGDGVHLEEVVYEGYAPGGVAILVEAVTDNKNRTAQAIKSVFNRGGGSLGTPGSVAFQFEQKGLILASKGDSTEERMLKLIDLGVEDVEEVEEGIEIYIKVADLLHTKEKLTQAGIEVKSAEVTHKPKNTVVLEEAKANKVINLIENLDDLEDVQKVHANLE